VGGCVPRKCIFRGGMHRQAKGDFASATLHPRKNSECLSQNRMTRRISIEWRRLSERGYDAVGAGTPLDADKAEEAAAECRRLFPVAESSFGSEIPSIADSIDCASLVSAEGAEEVRRVAAVELEDALLCALAGVASREDILRSVV
jgi:hypothetical protein